MDKAKEPWLSELGLNEESLKGLPPGENPILWAIKNHHIESEAYVNWAHEHFQVPKIDDSFFNFSMDSTLVEKHQSIHPWNSNCYPIYEWENLIYVACLEPLNLENSTNICFVIASPEAMERAWDKNHKEPNKPVEDVAPPVQKIPPPPVPDLDFSNLGFGSTDDNNTSQEEPQPIKKAPKKEAPQTEPSEALAGLSFSELNLSSPQSEQEINEEFDDDLTPPPVTKVVTPEPQKMASQQEVTDVDFQSPVYIPKEKRITNEDLKKHNNLNNCHGTKEILSHIFSHLTKDFQKLMWVELSESGQFFPRFVFGPWQIDSSAWTKAIDVSKPNIFKIAFKSSLPFHGEVRANNTNNSYFEAWNSGQAPNHTTIYPLIFEDACYGFIVGFDKEENFDEVGSLKKIENLISLCEKAFREVHMKKAS